MAFDILNQKKISLTVFERIILLEILNKISQDFIIKKVISDVENDVAFSDKELNALNISGKSGKVIWKKEAEKDKNIYLGKTAYKIIRDSLIEINDNDMFSEEHMELYNKFVRED